MADCDALIAALVACRRRGLPMRAADWASTVTSETQAYRAQDGVAQTLGWASPPRHWKSGGASALGPFSHSPLDPAGVTDGIARPQVLLGIEAEIALRLARPVSPADALAMQVEGAADWVDAMCVSVECVASRWAEGLAAPELLRMADCQSHGALLLGPWQPFRALDWAKLTWRLSQPGVPELCRVGGHSLGNPVAVLPAWLQHLTRLGATVPAGTVVTTGAWGGLHALSAAAAAGALCELEFSGLAPLRFSAAAG